MPHMMDSLYTLQQDSFIYSSIRDNLHGYTDQELSDVVSRFEELPFLKKVLHMVGRFGHFEYIEAKANINEREVTY